MDGLSTAIRAFLSRHSDTTTISSYLLLFGLVVVVVLVSAMIAKQLTGL